MFIYRIDEDNFLATKIFEQLSLHTCVLQQHICTRLVNLVIPLPTYIWDGYRHPPPNAFKLITFSTEAFSESLNFQIHKAAASN